MTNGKTLQVHYYLGQLINIINKNAKNKSELKDVTVKNAVTNDILTTVKTVPNILLIGIEVEHQSLSRNEKPGIISLKDAKEIVKAIDACPEGCVLLIKEEGPNQFRTLVVPDIENAHHYLKTNQQENFISLANEENKIVTEEDNKTDNTNKNDDQQSTTKQDKKYDYTNDTEYKKMVEEFLKATNKQERAEKVITLRDIIWKIAVTGSAVVGAVYMVSIFVKTMVESIKEAAGQGSGTVKEMVTDLYVAVTGNPVLTTEDLTTIITQLTNTSNQLNDIANSGSDIAVMHTASFNLFGTIKNFLTEWFSITNALGDEIFGKVSATGDIFGFALGVFGLFAIIALSARLFRTLFRIGFRENYVIREAEQQQSIQQVTPKQRKFGLFAAVSIILVALFTRLTKGVSLLGKIASTMLSGVLNIFSKRKTEAINLKEMFIQIKEFLKSLFRLIPATAVTIVGAFLRFAKGGILGIINFVKRHKTFNANTITADDKKIALEMGMKTAVLAK